MRQLAFHLSVGESEHEIQQRHPFLPIYIICSQNSPPSVIFYSESSGNEFHDYLNAHVAQCIIDWVIFILLCYDRKAEN